MTLFEVISDVDNQKPNTYNDAEKVRWLSVCERKIVDSVIKTHKDGKNFEFNGYTINDIDSELLVPDDYCDIYKYYLFAMIDATNGELQRYAGSMQLYNQMLSDYKSFYNRTHQPYGIQLSLF